MKPLLSRIWKGFLDVLKVIGAFQSRILLSVLYVLVVWPTGLFLRSRDPLGLKPRDGRGWTPRPQRESTLERFSHPF